jgi:uncharacterized protein (DUF2345 family)
VSQACEGPSFEFDGGVEAEQYPAGLVVSIALFVEVNGAIEPRPTVDQADVEAEKVLRRSHTPNSRSSIKSNIIIEGQAFTRIVLNAKRINLLFEYASGRMLRDYKVEWGCGRISVK